MDEKKEEQGTSKDIKEGSEPKAATLIETAHAENERMAQLIKELREENNRKEEIAAKQMLGGRSEAGQPIEEEEETASEYKNKVMSGKLNG